MPISDDKLNFEVTSRYDVIAGYLCPLEVPPHVWVHWAHFIHSQVDLARVAALQSSAPCPNAPPGVGFSTNVRSGQAKVLLQQIICHTVAKKRFEPIVMPLIRNYDGDWMGVQFPLEWTIYQATDGQCRQALKLPPMTSPPPIFNPTTIPGALTLPENPARSNTRRF